MRIHTHTMYIYFGSEITKTNNGSKTKGTREYTLEQPATTSQENFYFGTRIIIEHHEGGLGVAAKVEIVERVVGADDLYEHAVAVLVATRVHVDIKITLR